MNIREEIQNLVQEAFDPLMSLASKEDNANKLFVNLMSLFQMVADEVDNVKADADRYQSIKDEHIAMQEFFMNADGCEINDIYSGPMRGRRIRLEGTVEFEHLEFLKRLLEQKFTAYTKLPDVRY